MSENSNEPDSASSLVSTMVQVMRFVGEGVLLALRSDMHPVSLDVRLGDGIPGENQGS